MDKNIENKELIFQAIGENVPKTDGWGMYSYCDVNTPCGGGTGGFFWFNEKKDMLKLSRYLCMMFPISDGDYDPELFLENAKIIDMVEKEQINLKEGEQLLNKLLEGSLQVPWWGEVKELFTCETEFARDIRGSFWDEKKEDSSESENFQPIPDDRVGEFLEWLKEYI